MTVGMNKRIFLQSRRALDETTQLDKAAEKFCVEALQGWGEVSENDGVS